MHYNYIYFHLQKLQLGLATRSNQRGLPRASICAENSACAKLFVCFLLFSSSLLSIVFIVDPTAKF